MGISQNTARSQTRNKVLLRFNERPSRRKMSPRARKGYVWPRRKRPVAHVARLSRPPEAGVPLEGGGSGRCHVELEQTVSGPAPGSERRMVSPLFRCSRLAKQRTNPSYVGARWHAPVGDENQTRKLRF